MGEQLIELGLQQRPSLFSLVDQILAILPEAGSDSEKQRSSEFRETIQHYREQLRSQASVEPVARKILQTCQDHFRRSRMHRLEREHEYVELIEVLRTAVNRLAGRTTSFHSEIITSSERFGKLVEIDDIREIKNRISREVQGLRQAVEEKQKHDQESLSALSQRVEMLQVKLNRAKDEAATDALTRVANRGAFDNTLAQWIAGQTERNSSFVLALTDIDDFKKINDTHGHPIGDRVLMGAAQLLAASVRPSDFVARYGGEEFAVLMSGMKIAAAESRMKALLRTVAAHRFEYEAGFVQFTISCGMTEFRPGDTAETLIQRADEGLYEAKHKGKNRVVSRKDSLLRSVFG